MANEAELAKVKELWGSREGATWRTSNILHWLEHPRVQVRNNQLVSGRPDKNRFEYFIERYCPKSVDRILTLGCGHGEFERGLSQYGFARQHDAVDIAEGAIEDATRQAKDLGLSHVHYRVADLNTIRLPHHTYDVVFGISSIHHVANLEHLFEQVHRSLKPGGFFFLDEYIGPIKFQWTDAQLAAINQQLQIMPEEFRRSLHDGQPKGIVGRHTIAEMDAADPSEGVRSADIVPVLGKYFDILEVKGSGGTILHMLLEGIAGNFVESDPRAMKHLDSIFEFEDRMIAEGKLQHDFAVIIAKRREAKPEGLLSRLSAFLTGKKR